MPGKYKSEELRKLVVEAKQRGELVKDIAERYHCHRNTVNNIWTLWNETRGVKRQKKTGRPRKTRRMEPDPSGYPPRPCGVDAAKNEGRDQGERIPN